MDVSDSTLLRRVAHLDMDAFYASVELLRYPELRGQAVVIGGRSVPPVMQQHGQRQFARMRDYAGRGVVTTSTYEARALGVFSAMPMMRAAALAPDAILLPADFSRYREYSRRFKQAVAQIAPQIEDRGIDEIYIDLTTLPDTSAGVAHRIKQAVRDATGLSCSIGIAANKLLAKMASELDKPDGITLLTADQIPARIWPLPVSKINGIGPKATGRLASLGIHSIEDLVRAAPAQLQQHFGTAYVHWLLQAANGIDDRPVVTHSEPKSISRETTFERDLHVVRDRSELSAMFVLLCQQLEADLERKGCAGKTIGIKLRFDDFRTVTRDMTVPDPIMSAIDIHRAAGQCLKRVKFDRRIRLLGVRASKLTERSSCEQPGSAAGQLSFEWENS